MKPISFKTAVLQDMGVLFFVQSTINPAFWMMRSLLIDSLLCIVLNTVMYHVGSKYNRNLWYFLDDVPWKYTVFITLLLEQLE